MTNSVPIIHTDWTQVNLETSGSISNFGERDVYLRESLSKPSESLEDGFILLPGGNIPFAVANNLNVWARSKVANSKVLVSSGINRFEQTNDYDEERNQEALKEIVRWLKVQSIILADMQNMCVDEILEDLE